MQVAKIVCDRKKTELPNWRAGKNKRIDQRRWLFATSARTAPIVTLLPPLHNATFYSRIIQVSNHDE